MREKAEKLEESTKRLLEKRAGCDRGGGQDLEESHAQGGDDEIASTKREAVRGPGNDRHGHYRHHCACIVVDVHNEARDSLVS
jgi:hypothetical protein